MKKFSLLLATLLVATTLSAQQNKWRTISASSCGFNTQFSFTSGHQYTDHLFFGFGFGLDKTTVMNVTINDHTTGESTEFSVGGLAIPIYADGKWRIFDSWLSPSLRLRTGALVNLHMPGIGVFATPEIGLDISRYFSITWGWNGHLLYTPDYGWYHMTATPLVGVSVRF